MYKVGKLLGMILLVLLASGIIFVNTYVAAFPGDKPTIYIDPSTIKDPALTPSHMFTIEIKVCNVTAGTVPAGLYGVEVKLKWDPLLLELFSVDIRVGKSGGVLYSPVFFAKNETGAGYYWLAGASMPPALAWWGNGSVVKVTFHVIGTGKCALDLDVTDLVDYNALVVQHYKQGGVFDNRLGIPIAKLHVEPSPIVNSSMVPCENFTINITIEDAASLRNFAFKLGFNSTVLEATEATWALPGSGVQPEINNVAGAINGSYIIEPPLTGNATLVTIKFHVIALGESTLHLSDIKLTDEWEEAIPYETFDGYFNNMLITRLFVDPPVRIDPSLKPGDIITFDIKIENAVDLYGYEFKLGYNTDTLTCLGLVIIPPNNDTNFETHFSVNDTIGVVWVKVTYYPPAEPITIYSPKTLVTITFQIQSYGISVLDLYDTKLINQFGGLIPHEAEDGFFATVIRDVAIISVVPYPTKVYSGRIVNITVVAKNEGDLSETFVVSVYRNETFIQNRTVVSLPSHENITLIFQWDTTGLASCSQYEIRAEASHVPYEINIENNVCTYKMVKIKRIGDVDGDGTVGLTDLVSLAQAYGSKPGDPNWNTEADLNNDNRVNLVDLVTCGFHYGESCC